MVSVVKMMVPKMRRMRFFFFALYLSFHSYRVPEKKQAYDESVASYLGREKASTPFP